MHAPLTRLRPVAEAAFVTGRPHRTIRTWARLGRITTGRDARGHLLVDLVEAARLSDASSRRNRHTATP